MSQKLLIGIAGAAGSGKDTLANFIIATKGGYPYSFAEPIRDMLRQIGIDMRDPYWINNKEKVIDALGVSPRRLMQTLGTEWGRDMINADLWLILAKQRLMIAGPGMVISDVRFENEATWIRSLGGRVVHLFRPSITNVEEHVSESGVALHDNDIVIRNDGTLEHLQETVRRIFNGSKT